MTSLGQAEDIHDDNASKVNLSLSLSLIIVPVHFIKDWPFSFEGKVGIVEPVDREASRESTLTIRLIQAFSCVTYSIINITCIKTWQIVYGVGYHNLSTI